MRNTPCDGCQVIQLNVTCTLAGAGGGGTRGTDAAPPGSRVQGAEKIKIMNKK